MLEQEAYLSIEFIEMINYCDINKRSVYLEVVRCFNNMSIKGNLNSQSCYRTFLKNYLGAIGTLGYADYMETWQLEGKDGIENSLEIVQYYLAECMRELDKSALELEKCYHTGRLEPREIKAVIKKRKEK